jgi:hypothetical protein
MRDAVEVQAAIDIAAPPEHVAALYRDVETWHETFSVTIEQARITATGENWKQVEVTHRTEGKVPNTLIFLSETEIALEESKQRFNAVFLNQFLPMAQRRTHYMITAYITLKGIYRIMKPFVEHYVHRQALKQMGQYVLAPLKTAAEKARR